MTFAPQPSLEDLTFTGDISALNEVIELIITGISGGKAVISGTWSGTIKFQGTVDGNRWDPIGSFSGTTGVPVSTTGITSNDIIVFVGIAGLQKIRAIFTSYTSGTATVTLRASNGVSNVFVDNLIPSNFKSQIYGVKEDGSLASPSLSPTGATKVAITDRPSEVRSRIYICKNIDHVILTSTPTIIHTVTEGYKFYLVNIILAIVNQQNQVGRFNINDNGSVIIPVTMAQKPVGATEGQFTQISSFVEPLQFSTNVRVTEVAGDIIASITIVGYEEPV